MPCIHLPGGGIACTGRTRRPRCACGETAGFFCDWKDPKRRSGTCDKPICTRCRVSPQPGKDLCPGHATAWEAWKAERASVAAPEQAQA